MPYLVAEKETSGKLVRTGQDVKFRAGFEIGGSLGLNSGGIITIKLAGAIAGLGLAVGDSVILTYEDWAPKGIMEVKVTTPAPLASKTLPKELDLSKYPWYSQRDAKGHGEAFRMCNSSSHAMVVSYLYAVLGLTNPMIAIARRDGIGVDDVFLLDYVHEFGDSTDHEAITKALKKLGIESKFCYDLSVNDLRKSLSLGIPMVLGVLHHGAVSAPSGGGHMITAVKMNGENDVICYDPYGEGFEYANTNGKAVHYPINPTLTARWLCGNPNGGWGRIFTKVGAIALPLVR
jgi:hypothetical protein